MTLISNIQNITNQSQTKSENNNITSKNTGEKSEIAEITEIPEIPEIPEKKYSNSYEELIKQLPKPGEKINGNIEEINLNLDLIEKFINCNKDNLSNQEFSYLKKLRKKLTDKRLKINNNS